MLLYSPAVFAVKNEYQIMVPVSGESLLWVKVGGECYYDECNGIMRSLERVHRVSVPMEALDAAGEYTVCEKELIDRKPYFPESRETVETVWPFHPVRTANPKAYHISDAHNMIDQPSRAALACGPIDFLILNGDLPNHSGTVENFYTIYAIADKVTHGSIPIVFARGNHDLRGYMAEKFADYTPADRGNTYYTFRLGSVWGIILDCGEDKDDSHAEYGFTVSCKGFRRRQTEFIRSVIRNADWEYLAEGVTTRLVIAHTPFVYSLEPPFDIERDVYGEWAALLRENVHPDLLISGHLHTLETHLPGDGWSSNGELCPIVVGGTPDLDGYYCGCSLEFGNRTITVAFNREDGKILDTVEISR